MQEKKKKVLLGMLTLTLAVSGFAAVQTWRTALAAGNFVPNPQTAYARTFLSQCENQQWFMNEVERLLNAEQKTLNTITSSADLSDIKSIGLADRTIIGKIPKAIGELHELRSLFLSDNELSGAIPSELFSLDKLTNIDLSGNKYSGAIPAGFGNMAGLNVLMLRGNSYSGTIPDSILTNTRISVLDVSGNRLAGAIPAGLNQMTGLTYLAISDNPWAKGPIPDFSALSSLKTLSAWNANLTGNIPDYIYTLSELQVLDLANNNLTGIISDDIGNLTALQLLALGDNNLTGTIPDSLYTLASLEALDLSENGLTGEISSDIGNLIELETLVLADNKLEGTIPEEFDNLTNLLIVDLSDNRLRGHVPACFADIPQVYLHNNYLTGTVLKGITDSALNFCDGAKNAQYQLIATTSLHIASSPAITNAYPLLKNKYLPTGSTTMKAILAPDCYDAWISNDPNGKVELTRSAIGIYVSALDDISSRENIILTIQIKANTGSGYSTVNILLYTSAAAGFGGGGGGGGGGWTTPQALEATAPAIDSETTSSGITDAAQAVTHTPYISGYKDGTFRPNSSITREEVAVMLVRALGYETTKPAKKPFPDVPADSWSAPYIAKAKDLGFVKGYSDGKFKPKGLMSRAELAACLVQIAQRQGLNANGKTIPFTDVEKGKWYAGHVDQAAKYGLITGYDDLTFRPNDPVSRAEAVSMVNQMLGRNPDTAAALQTIKIPFDDVNRSHWACLHILEASVSHKH